MHLFPVISDAVSNFTMSVVEWRIQQTSICRHLNTIGVWSVPVVFSRDKAAAAWFFIPVRWTISFLSSDNRSQQCTSFAVDFVRFRIHFSSWWSVQTVNWESSVQSWSINTAHNTVRVSQKLSNALSESFIKREQYLIGLSALLRSFCSKTQSVCKSHASVHTV